MVLLALSMVDYSIAESVCVGVVRHLVLAVDSDLLRRRANSTNHVSRATRCITTGARVSQPVVYRRYSRLVDKVHDMHVYIHADKPASL